jgi:hypothetical protein
LDRIFSNERDGGPLYDRRLVAPSSGERLNVRAPSNERLGGELRDASPKERDEPPLNERLDLSLAPREKCDESPLNEREDMLGGEDWPRLNERDEPPSPPRLNEREEPPPSPRLKEREEPPPSPRLNEREEPPRSPPRPRSSRSASAFPPAIRTVSMPTTAVR